MNLDDLTKLDSFDEFIKGHCKLQVEVGAITVVFYRSINNPYVDASLSNLTTDKENLYEAADFAIKGQEFLKEFLAHNAK